MECRSEERGAFGLWLCGGERRCISPTRSDRSLRLFPHSNPAPRRWFAPCPLRPAGSARSENAGGGVWQRCNGVVWPHLGCGDRRFGARTVSGGVPSGTADWLTKTNSKLRPPRCTAKPTSSSDSTGYPWISTSRASSGTLRPAACAGLASITPCTRNSAESLPCTVFESCSTAHAMEETGSLWLTARQTPPEPPCPAEDRPRVQDESGRLATPA